MSSDGRSDHIDLRLVCITMLKGVPWRLPALERRVRWKSLAGGDLLVAIRWVYTRVCGLCL